MSRYEADDRFDFSKLLDWKKAQVVQGDASGLQPDETYVLQWTVPFGAQEQAREWIYANRQGFQGPEIPFMQLEGFWRTVQVRYQVIEPKVSNAGVNILQTIAKGYYTALDWDAARILQGERAASNTSGAGVPNSGSAAIDATIQVRFPFIAPEAVAGVLSVSSVPSPLVIRDNNLGTLKRIVTSARLEEDGSYSVIATLADPQYTLASYTDFGGVNQQDVYYLWDVPKDFAQGIIDSWKSENPVGSSASADYNDQQKLVNIVLRRNAFVKPNLTLAGINVACDTTQNFHFAWGYEKADIDAFIQSHNGPTGTGSRQVQVQTRSDGLYDITVIETTVTALPPPHFIIALAVGDKITTTQKYGWNISIAQLNAIKADYEKKDIGHTKQFRVTRKDNCTFDYEGVVVAQTEQTVEVKLEGTGVQTRSKQVRGTSQTTAPYSAGKRKRHRLEVRKEDDGTNTITATEEEIVAGTLTKLSSGGSGVSSEAGAFSNLDSLPTIPQSNKRIRVQPDIRVNEDGTYTGGYSQTTVQAVNKAEVGGGTGVIDTASAYSNLDSPPTPTQSAKRKRVRHRIQANDDGTFSGGEETTEVQAVPQTEVAVGGNGVFVESATYANQDSPPSAPASAARVRVQSEVRANDDGTFSGGYTKQTVQIGEGSGSITGNGITLNVRAKSNADSVDTEYSADKRERVSLSISPNDDGTVNFVESKQTLVQVSVEEVSVSGDGIETTSKAGKNLDSPPSNPFTAAKRTRHNLNLSANDDGTWDFSGTEQKVVETPQSTMVGSDSQSKKVYYAENIDPNGEISIPGILTGQSISVKDDGTIGYVAIAKNTDAPVKMENTYESKGVSTKYVAQIGGKVDDVPAASSSNEGVENEVQLRPDEDGSGGYVHVERTWNVLGPIETQGGTKLQNLTNKELENAKEANLSAWTSPVSDRGKSRRVDLRVDPVSGKIRASIVEGEAKESSEYVDKENDGLTVRTISKKRNAQQTYDIGTSQGRSISQINDDETLDVIKETLELDSSLSSVQMQYYRKRREYADRLEESTRSGTASRWKTNSDGDNLQLKRELVWTYQRTKSIYRDITEEVKVSYSLTRPSATISSPSDEGEYESSVTMVKAGLWMLTEKTIDVTDWTVGTTGLWGIIGNATEVKTTEESDGDIRLTFSTTNKISTT